MFNNTAVLPADLGSIPSSHMGESKPSVTTVLGNLMPHLASKGTKHTDGTQTHVTQNTTNT